jgi:hypothetical protein
VWIPVPSFLKITKAPIWDSRIPTHGPGVVEDEREGLRPEIGKLTG